MAERTSSPGYAGYFAGAVLIVLGLSFGLPRIVDAVRRMMDIPGAIMMPGKDVVYFDEPGVYKIYLEPDAAQGGRYSRAGDIPGFDVSVENRRTGEFLSLKKPGYSENYSIGSRSGFLIFRFRAPEAGEYVVSASYAPGEEGPGFGLVVGELGILRTLLEVFGGVGLIFAGTALGVVAIVLTYMKRGKASGEGQTGEASE